MVGRDVILKIEKPDPKPGKPVLEVKNLEKLSDEGKVVLDHISFTIREGEVLGIAGVEGNGQNYLSDCISGMQKYDGGDVLLNGTEKRHEPHPRRPHDGRLRQHDVHHGQCDGGPL